MKIKKCAVCGIEFESHNGMTVCSENCRLERARKQNKEYNYRRRNGLSNTSKEKVCPVCGKKFDAFKNMVYCGNECYEMARAKKSRENSREYYSNPEWRKQHIENVINLKKNTN